MPKGRRLTQEQMAQQVAELQLRVKSKQERVGKSEQKRIAELSAKIERVREMDAEEPRLIAPPAPSRRVSRELEDILIEQARQSLREYGTLLPPKEALYTNMSAVCPHCGEEKKIATEFGFKKYKSNPKDPNCPETIRPQSWCRECRNGKDAHPTRSKS